MNAFMNIVVFSIAMLLFTTQTTCSIENNERPSSELRRALFVPVKNSLSKRTSKLDDVKFFEGISESSLTTTTERSSVAVKRKNQNATDAGEKSYDDLKVLLTKLLDKIGNIEKDEKRDADVEPSKVVSQRIVADPARVEAVSATAQSYKNIHRKRKVKDRAKNDKKQRWGKWTNWSPCSVSCGKGREIRWRHCLENCDVAETEMEEKTCQLPACGPAKLFGVIKL